MSIPLVQNNEKDSINTSIIAIKRQIERINMLLGLSNSEEIDTSKFATKDELQQAVTDLQPVNEVAVDNMHSVTSNAVALKFGKIVWLKGRNITKKTPNDRPYFIITDFYPDITNDYIMVQGHGYCTSGNFQINATATSGVDNANSNLIYFDGGTFTMLANTTYSGINFDIFAIKMDLFT